MIVILGFDGLDHGYAKEFGFPSLLQASHGTTDLSGFSQPRTVVIWSSFVAARNTEKEVLSHEDLWGFRLRPGDTFFSRFRNWRAIDVPGFTHDYERHKKEREAMRLFFENRMTQKEYDKIMFENHKATKEEFFGILADGPEIVMGYFALADVTGHTSFGNKLKMRIVYKELDAITERVKKDHDPSMLLVVSDHGMKPVGRYGDHSGEGFWSLSDGRDLGRPRPWEIPARLGWV